VTHNVRQQQNDLQRCVSGLTNPQTRAKDVLPTIHRTQGRRSHPPAATKWCRLPLSDVICSERVPFRRCRGDGSGQRVCCSWWPWPLTLTFKLVRARDQTRFPSEFGSNPFSRSPGIWGTNKKNRTLKTEPYLCAVTIEKRNLLKLFLPPYVIKQAIIFLSCGFFCLLSIYLLFSSPNRSRRRLDVYHTSTNGVALVRI